MVVGYQRRNSIGMTGRCGLCKRILSVEGDPLSADCGGDCWGCIGQIEADLGGDPQQNISKEIEWGWRERDGTPKLQSFFQKHPKYWPTE